MPSVFTSDQIAAFRRPHVNRAWFVTLFLASETIRMHSGVGRVTVGGFEWIGVANPVGKRLVSLGSIEEPRFGTAAAIGITISGVDISWFQSVKSIARDMEGRSAKVEFAMFDAETQEVIGSLVPVFPSGYISSPSLQRSNGIRTVTLTIESVFNTRNYAPTGKWNNTGQQQRYPGDKFFNLITAKVQEIWK